MNGKNIALYSLLAIVVLLPYVGLGYVIHWYKGKVKQIERASVLVVDKESMTVSVVDYKGFVKANYPMACGLNYGNKQKRGDMRTPEGLFHVDDILDASSWKHDFKDGKGEIEGAYGPWFIRLDVPGHQGIGIHGTHLPESIGTRASEGCIRLKNEDIIALKNIVYVGMPVIITPSYEDAVAMLQSGNASQASNQQRINLKNKEK